ncbi:MAG: hypothetical protein J0H98_01275 [Solirubrobacterales bacterium]|nr:hypothetical protein [Solirubrobacterales bacterium]
MRIFAYLDPGSASAVLAAILAGVAGIGAALRTFGHNVKSKVMFWKKDEPAPEAPAAAADTSEDKPAE